MKKIYIVSVFAILQLSCTDFMNLFHSYNYGSQDFEDIDPKLKEGLTKRFNLPPDPGEEGKKKLFGIDADKDGLRDDVQRWIYFHYPDEPLIRKALRQAAIDHIETFKYVDDKEKSIKASKRAADSRSCLDDILVMVYLKKGQRIPFETLQIIKVIENTRERHRAARKSDGNFSGQRWRAPKPLASCRFEVEHPNKDEYLKKYGN